MIKISELKEAWDDFQKRPRGIYNSATPGHYEWLASILNRVRCEKCEVDRDGTHGTCPNCLFHGDFIEPGECIQCSRCHWGHST